jgi:DNA-directed RNA polymerase specialized sigma24 family protein
MLVLPEESVSEWIQQLKAGDSAAAQKLWERYFLRLVELARQKLGSRPRRLEDEEDVALSAFDSVCRGAARGLYPQVADRDDLWRLLVVITARKTIDLHHYEARKKRGGGQELEEYLLEQVLSRDPDPEFAAEMAEACQRRLNSLEDQELRLIAVLKVEGYTNEEIAGKLGCQERTVARRLKLIRERWRREEDL